MSGTIHSGLMQRADVELDCDTVVIGSGASGAVMAANLAEAGERVIVLEEGPQLPALEHGAMRQSESIRHLWRDGAMTLALGLGGGPSINVTTGRALGGSSMLTGGVSFRIPDHVLDAWSKGLALPELSLGASFVHTSVAQEFKAKDSAIAQAEGTIGLVNYLSQTFTG